MSFRQRLPELRKRLDYTQNDLAQILNVSQSTIAMWETGKRDPSTEDLLRLSNLFKVSIDYLLGSDANTSLGDNLLDEFPEGVQILRRANRELTPEAKARMIEIANIFIDSVNQEDGGNHD